LTPFPSLCPFHFWLKIAEGNEGIFNSLKRDIHIIVRIIYEGGSLIFTTRRKKEEGRRKK
jgi:hypothetical protein